VLIQGVYQNKMARPLPAFTLPAFTLPAFTLPAADQAALEAFTRPGCRSVRAVRRAQALLALARGVGPWRGPAGGRSSRGPKSPDREPAPPPLGRSGLASGAGRSAAAVPSAALAGPPVPVGHRRWTLRLLADKAGERCLGEPIPHETGGPVLKKTRGRPTAGSTGAWGRSMPPVWPVGKRCWPPPPRK
jgi:hypothetical protein